MAGDDQLPQAKRQTEAERKYAALKRAVEEAGFFAPRVTGEPDGDQIVCTSTHLGGTNYSGRIAFVTEVGGDWYIATPHPRHYRILDPTRVGEAVVAFLGQRSTSTVVQIDHQEYEQAVGRA